MTTDKSGAQDASETPEHPYLEEFLAAYITCALWSSTTDDPDFKGKPEDNPGGVPLDQDHGPSDLSPKCLASMRADCKRFLNAYAQAIESATYSGRYDKWEYAGHDFWLTRCGHGCGFWDGDWSEPEATVLTDACKTFPNVDLYVGDNGEIYAL